MAPLTDPPHPFPQFPPPKGGVGIVGKIWAIPAFPQKAKMGIVGNHRNPVFTGAKGWNHARSRL